MRRLLLAFSPLISATSTIRETQNLNVHDSKGPIVNRVFSHEETERTYKIPLNDSKGSKTTVKNMVSDPNRKNSTTIHKATCSDSCKYFSDKNTSWPCRQKRISNELLDRTSNASCERFYEDIQDFPLDLSIPKKRVNLPANPEPPREINLNFAHTEHFKNNQETLLPPQTSFPIPNLQKMRSLSQKYTHDSPYKNHVSISYITPWTNERLSYTGEFFSQTSVAQAERFREKDEFSQSNPLISNHNQIFQCADIDKCICSKKKKTIFHENHEMQNSLISSSPKNTNNEIWSELARFLVLYRFPIDHVSNLQRITTFFSVNYINELAPLSDSLFDVICSRFQREREQLKIYNYQSSEDFHRAILDKFQKHVQDIRNDAFSHLETSFTSIYYLETEKQINLLLDYFMKSLFLGRIYHNIHQRASFCDWVFFKGLVCSNATCSVNHLSRFQSRPLIHGYDTKKCHFFRCLRLEIHNRKWERILLHVIFSNLSIQISFDKRYLILLGRFAIEEKIFRCIWFFVMNNVLPRAGDTLFAVKSLKDSEFLSALIDFSRKVEKYQRDAINKNIKI